MSFISPEFILFAIVFFPVYFVLGQRWRWLWILVASYFFYAYGHAEYLWIILLTTGVDYVVARLIDRSDDPRRRKLLLALSLSLNLGVLFTFKYFNFFNESFGAVFHLFGASYQISAFTLALPVGISFYTFQSMAYTIDVYRGKLRAEKRAGVFATFVAFFPQLVAGPIERAPHMLPQYRRRLHFDEERTVEGLRRILWGFFKKVVIADRLAIYVNAVYSAPQSYSGFPLIVATIFFAFQIYCDFSAYTDIAIGVARIMGFDLMENFRQPYFARSVREFWARWHISLSTWFRDYLYIPLGGSRVPFPRHLLNLFIVFLVSGLWHGASWTFVIWGGLHGFYVVAEALWTHLRRPAISAAVPALLVSGESEQKHFEHSVVGAGLRPAPTERHTGRIVFRRMRLAPLQIGGTFMLVCFAFIFFRANSFADAAYVVTHLFAFGHPGGLTDPFATGLLSSQFEFVLSFGLIGLLLGIDALDARFGLNNLFRLSPITLRWLVYYCVGAAVLFSGLYGSGAQEFIYFQF
jgi:alginate O-acetyltransferase complex protein AlgI